MDKFAKNILASRKKIVAGLNLDDSSRHDAVQEGGCGVVGFASTIPVRGRHIFEPSIQMRNRGNGKGGGIAAAGLVPEQLGVDPKTLRDDYILQIALLDPGAAGEAERFITENLRVDHTENLWHLDDHRDVGLEVRPPDIARYFVRVKDDKLNRFAEENDLADQPSRAVEDEFIYQNSFNFNVKFYAALGEKRAFILSHARNLMIFKIVGYAEQVVRYYGLEDFKSNLWIAHQRYPTKGRVWHPAGAHPFIGMNEALVHNGDFANYFSISQYLRQHNIVPLFLTDTEVSVLLFDLWRRVWRYPIEYVIEALAPTTEMDFAGLPEKKKRIYRAIQATHMHASPDGPWFFIIASSNPDDDRLRLLGITDTAMLRPQVFALQQGDVGIGLIGSEKQAIDATLHSLSEEDPRFRPIADRYWNARGGSHTDGGAFSFTIENASGGNARLSCTDKFGKSITCPPGDWTVDLSSGPKAPGGPKADKAPADLAEKIEAYARRDDAKGLFTELSALIPKWNFDSLRWLTSRIEALASHNGPPTSHLGLPAEGPGASHPGDQSRFYWALDILCLLNDRRYNCGRMKRSVVLQIVRQTINSILKSVPSITDTGSAHAQHIDWSTRDRIRPPKEPQTTLVIHAHEFPPEGEQSDAKLLVRAYELGWKRFIVYGLIGQRFTGCGFGPDTAGARIDLFGSSGDYVASGIDGMEIYIHNNAQDQLAQIMKTGRLVIYGDVGQAFMYGAKGGEVYVLGNAAGRPLINAVGRPRVVINGTCLDFLAESFMAGDPLKGGGFVVLNGIEFDNKGRVVPQGSPYPGSNLFSLASGGAIYIRDPHHKLVDEQLNGGRFAELAEEDWLLIRPYLQTNEQLFGISIDRDLLTVDGVRRAPEDVYRKVSPVKSAVLAAQELPE
jgi:glutamate synthase domain-containing protein 1/glutamate synthase domain-containing protein 3